MRRPLALMTASYIYGIVAAELCRYFPITVIVVSVSLFAGVTYLFLSNPPLSPFAKEGFMGILGMGRFSRGFLSLPLLVSVCAGFSYMLYSSRIPDDDISRYETDEKMTVIGIVDEPARFSAKKVMAHVQAMRMLRGEKEARVRGRVRVTIYDPEVVLGYGDIIRFNGKLKTIRGFKNPGLFDYADYMARAGIRASVSVGKGENISKMGSGGNPLLKKIYGWREEIRLSILRGLSGPSSAILQAMVIGEMGDITPEVRDKFNAAGVTHILSISGSHLGFVTLIVFFIIRYSLMHIDYRILRRISLFIIPSKIAAFATAPPVIFYTFLSGGEVATVRSLIMALVYLTAILIEREDDAINTLSVAALLVLLWNPQALFDISFQLSYMAVLSMILVVKIFRKRGEISGWWKRFWNRATLFMLLTLGATLSTAPIVAHYYNQITWVGVISNMIVVPFVGFAVLPVGLLTCSLALISHAHVIPLTGLNDLLLRLLYQLVCLFARFPLSVIYTPSPGIPLIISIYLIMLSCLFFKSRWARVSIPLSISLLAISLGCNVVIKDKEGMMRVTFLDVGQGDSAIIEFPDGKVMAIDGGGTYSETFDIGRAILAPYLWNSGIRNIDYVIVTHPQLDHVEGLAYVVGKFNIGEVWTNGTTGAAARLFDTVVQERKIKQVTIHRGTDDMRIGGCKINFINPPEEIEKGGYKDNDLSIVIRLACKGLSLLFTGDIEERAMREIAMAGIPLDSTVIKVPHHGARGSVEGNFISAAKPRIAVISVGYQNIYHHPSREAISAYEGIGAAVYRTDRDGAVIVEAKDGKIRIKAYEDMALKRIDFDHWSLLYREEFSNLNKLVAPL